MSKSGEKISVENKNNKDFDTATTILIIEAVLTLISALIFGQIYKDISDPQNISMFQAQVLFLCTVLFIVGIVGMVVSILHINQVE